MSPWQYDPVEELLGILAVIGAFIFPLLLVFGPLILLMLTSNP